MANRWEKEDRVVWKKSEVMQELERKVLDNMHRFEEMARKASVDKSASAFENASRNWTPTQWKEYKGDNNALIDAELIDDAEEADSDLVDNEVVDNEADDGVTKEAMVDELRQMAQVAISKGNIKVAYQIERTIEEILEEEL